jgi:hypothetical protein
VSTTARQSSLVGHAIPRRAVPVTLWGLLTALLAALALLAITPRVWSMGGGRGPRLQDSMLVLEHGGPLLVGRYGGDQGAYYNITLGDDEGEFVYVPVMSRLFGVSNPLVMFRYLYIALVVFTAALYPAVFYRLTRSWLAAVAAPLMFLACMVSIGFLDMYWVPAWGALTLLPLVFLLARAWPRFGILAIAGLALAASWMSSIRSDSGLGIAIAAALLLLLRRWRWWRLLPALAMVAVLYISIGAFAFGAIRADRDNRIGKLAAKRVDVTNAHSLWHEAYAGLGYLRNGYGLRYTDAVSANRVLRQAPGVTFLSSRYEAVLRQAYFQFARDHPAEFIRQYGAKLLVAIADTAPYLLLVALTLPAMLLRSSERHIVRRWALLTLPAAIVAFLPTMVALPMESYEQGLYGAVGAIGIVGLCWMLRWLEAGVRERGGVRVLLAGAHASRRALAHSADPAWRSVRISIGMTAILIVVSFAGYFVRREANHWQGTPSGVLMELYPFRN